MCGIAGVVYFDSARPAELSTLKTMADSIAHRGPDDEGFYINGNVGLAFRRLSIIDLDSGHQPISNEDKSVWIVFNGEIYNYLELRDLSLKKGYKFKTRSDTEVILHLYEEYGEGCLQFLRGMFAFAIWDSSRRRLFCARDRFGIKPFFYYMDAEKFVFASELKAIKTVQNVDLEISPKALDSYFTYGYITDDLSIYGKVKKLRPAHYCALDSTNPASFQIKRYWDIIFEPDYTKSESVWMDEIQSALSESVKAHMVSDVPLGAFLSGGIDSSSVVAMMSKHSSYPVKTFSIGFREQQFNELEYAREVSARFGTEHYEYIVEPDSIDILDKLVSCYDEPFADSSAIPTYFVSKFAGEKVKVVLSGDGGDELFAGYNRYKNMFNITRLFFNKRLMNEHFFRYLYRILPDGYRGKRLAYYLSLDKHTAYAYSTTMWNQHERDGLYGFELANYIRSNKFEDSRAELLTVSSMSDLLSKFQELDLQTYLPDDILTKVDRASMRNSLEVRVPILDHKFAELSFRIPSSFKLNKGQQKYIFKNAFSKFLPSRILSHRKQGFAVPLSYWFRGNLKDYVSGNLNGSSRLTSFLNKSYIQHIVSNHQRGSRDLSAKIWSLLFFEAWLRGN